jgi:hypothetical protein
VLNVTCALLETAMSPTPTTTRCAKRDAMVGEAMRQVRE